MKDVVIIIPAFNEEQSIGVLLDRMREAAIMDYADVVVINDASRDKTSWIAKDHGVAVINNVFNLGYGAALQLGYKYAVRYGYSYLIQMDADGQHDISNVHALYERLLTREENDDCPDIVIGSRFLQASQSFPISFVKAVAIRLFRWVIRVTSGQMILDPTSGLQGLSRRAFLHYSVYQNFNFMYPDANMIIQMIMLGFRVVEIPSVMHKRENGASMHSGILRPLIYMMIMPLSMISIYFRVKTGLQKKAEMAAD